VTWDNGKLGMREEKNKDHFGLGNYIMFTTAHFNDITKLSTPLFIIHICEHYMFRLLSHHQVSYQHIKIPYM
jgi:hypothetical protein